MSMPVSTPRSVLAAALLGLPLAASAQPAPPPTTPPAGVVTIDGALTDTPYTLLATDGGRAGLGFGANNQLNAIYMHADTGTNRLNIGIAGITERNDDTGNRNSVVVFLDTKAGGYATFDYGRDNGPDFGNGVTNLNSGSAFDVGFTADYALQVGCSAGDCFASLFTLAGTAMDGGGSTLFLGSTSDPDFAVALPADGDQDSRTTGFEISLTYSADGVGADLALDRNSVQAFALITGASGFVSDQFLTPADDLAGNYGFDAANFEQFDPGPASYVFQPIEGRKGWRMLAWPVQGGTVGDYVSQNHVQGLLASFPGGTPNLLLGYGAGGYDAAEGLEQSLESGHGQYWYHYDAADFPGGAPPAGSNFRPLPYRLRAGGIEPQSDVVASFPGVASGATGFVIAGNPFSLDFDVAGMTAISFNTVGPLVYVWDPDMGTAGGYAIRDRNAADASLRRVAPMQGMFVEARVASPPPPPALGDDGNFSVVFAQSARVQSNTPILSRTVAQRVLGFELASVAGEGVVTEWTAARLAFVEGADMGADAFDAGQPAAPDASREARIAVVGPDGEMLGQESRPYDLVGTAEARMALRIAGRPDAATYRLTWPTMESLPAEWALDLRDADTGTVLDLRAADHYDFTASPGDWTERFVVSVASRSTAAEAAPAETRLGAPQPNPAARAARLALSVDRAQTVRADLFDALGRQVAVVLDATVDAPQDLVVPTAGLAPGLYVLRVVGETFVETRTLTVAR